MSEITHIQRDFITEYSCIATVQNVDLLISSYKVSWKKINHDRMELVRDSTVV
jgi:hypothetical protein